MGFPIFISVGYRAMADEARLPRFELHIQPLMRLLDRDHMRPFELDLWNYDDVRAGADDILEFLQNGPMPLRSHGGPWPHEWIDLFRRWKDTGFHQLERGTAAGGYTAVRSGTLVTLAAKGRVPSPGFTVWLNLERAEADRREYKLVQEPPVAPVPGPDRPFNARERFETDAASVVVSVNDSQGTHDVPVTGAAFLHILGSPERVTRELMAIGNVVSPESRSNFAETTMKFEGHVLRLSSDEMFTEVSGTPEALEAFGRRMGARARR